MNKIIPFSKDIHFKDKIGEIVSIKIEDKLKFAGDYVINGDLVISGINKNDNFDNDFLYTLPVDIAIDAKYDITKSHIAVDDFYYEIINEDILRVNIELCLDNLYYQDDNREINLDVDFTKKKDIVDANIEVSNDNKQMNIDLEKKKNDSLSASLKIENKKEEENIEEENMKDNSLDKEYSIYRVYTFLESDTIEGLLSKYKITMEELELYNDLSKIVPGTKLIIPSIDE